ncbi:hypothetical protein CI238_12786 [Colletotrichum incanum]|uniref:BTB domain-containing protein n=1 Tax=Colletotrichum incanum TaxID=1573173 RepID=A0A166LQN9_COLIC|nr:hypothetical protein CI238_12786 [Colletotrichum incanum]
MLFTVHRDLIRASPELEKIRGYFNEIRIRDVPDEAGHVLVHYLYTGTWQTLHENHPQHDSKTSAHFETSVHVYAAARAYSLPGLAELAKENICQSADALPALEVIVLAAGACEFLLDDDSWFLAFIKLRVGHLFKEPASLNQSVFLGCFRVNTPYSKILAETLVLICCENSLSLQSAESRDLSRPELSTVSETDATPSTDASHTTQYLASEPSPEPAPDFETEPSVEVVAEPEPSLEVAAEPEPVAWADVVAEPEPTAEVATEPQPEACMESIPGLEPEPEPVAEIEEDGWSWPKKAKKKGKKGKKVESQEVFCFWKETHLVDGGWEDCSSCRQYVGKFVSSYHQSKANS